jgi:hypothetical protein
MHPPASSPAPGRARTTRDRFTSGCSPEGPGEGGGSRPPRASTLSRPSGIGRQGHRRSGARPASTQWVAGDAAAVLAILTNAGLVGAGTERRGRVPARPAEPDQPMPDRADLEPAAPEGSAGAIWRRSARGRSRRARTTPASRACSGFSSQRRRSIGKGRQARLKFYWRPARAAWADASVRFVGKEDPE